jgi:Lipopolysaccharide-assembly
MVCSSTTNSAANQRPPAVRPFSSIRRSFSLVMAAIAVVFPACAWDGQFSILGYTTRPNYDPGIRTIRVPIFKNNTFIRGLEFDLTRAVIREIEARTPFKVVSEDCPADTELTGKITVLTKLAINRTQLNEIREGQTTLGVEIVWRDLRTGEILSQPRPKSDPDSPAPPPPDGPPKPLLIQSLGSYIPELGGSTTTSLQQNVNRMAVQIVSKMEMPW